MLLHKGKTYELTLGENDYSFDEDHLTDLKFSASAPNYGMYGIATGQFSCRAYAENAENILQNLTPNMPVSFSELRCELILTSAAVDSKNVLSITASTKTINSGISFYNDSYIEKGTDGKSLMYDMDKVVEDAFRLFDVPYSYSASSGMKLYLCEFEGKSCSSVIEEASKLYGGYFCMQPSGFLVLNVYGQNSDTIDGTNPDNISDTLMQPERAISKIIVTDSESGDTSIYGNAAAPWYETETLEGDYLFGEAVCKSAAESMLHSYRGWSCDNVIVNQTPNLNSLFRTSSADLVVQKIDISYTKNHIVASLGADTVQTSYSDYKNAVERKLASKVKSNSIYGNTVIDSKDGLMFVWQEKSESNTRTSERYSFSTSKGGVIKYGGAMVDSKFPEITFKSDASGFTTKYGDTSIEYEMSIDGDNLTLKEKEGD